MEYQHDFYELFGLNPDSSYEELKRQYNYLRKKYHPDTAQGKLSAYIKECSDASKIPNPDILAELSFAYTQAKETMKLINEAWEIFSTPAYKHDYDQWFQTKDQRSHLEITLSFIDLGIIYQEDMGPNEEQVVSFELSNRGQDPEYIDLVLDDDSWVQVGMDASNGLPAEIKVYILVTKLRPGVNRQNLTISSDTAQVVVPIQVDYQPLPQLKAEKTHVDLGKITETKPVTFRIENTGGKLRSLTVASDYQNHQLSDFHRREFTLTISVNPRSSLTGKNQLFYTLQTGTQEVHLQVSFYYPRTRVTLSRVIIERQLSMGQKLIFDDQDLSGLDLTGLNLSGCSFMYTDISKTRFQGSDLSDCNFQHSLCHQTDFSRSSLTGADLSHVRGRNCRFLETKLDQTVFNSAFLPEAEFANLQAESVDLYQATLINSRFTRTIWNSPDFSQATCTGVIFQDSLIRHGSLQMSDWTGAKFSKSTLVLSDCQRAQFTGASFKPASLIGCNLAGASLRSISVDRLNLRVCHLAQADLSHNHFRTNNAIYITHRTIPKVTPEIGLCNRCGQLMPSLEVYYSVASKVISFDHDPPNPSDMVVGKCSGCGRQTEIAYQLNTKAISWAGAKAKASLFVDELNLAGIDLSRVDLREASLELAWFSYSTLTEAQLAGIRATAARFDHATLTSAVFDHAYLRQSTFNQAQLKEARFELADLRQSYMANANLNRAWFERANLNQANLSSISAINANFTLAQLNQANLASADLSGAQLINAQLQWCNLSQAKGHLAQFQGADLTQAILDQAHMNRANFSLAVLTGASLRGADLTLANMSHAMLIETNCYMTKFWLADLSNAKLDSARYDRHTVWPQDFLPQVFPLIFIPDSN